MMRHYFQRVTVLAMALALTVAGCRNKIPETHLAIDTAGLSDNHVKDDTAGVYNNKKADFVAYHSKFMNMTSVLVNGHAVILPYDKFSSLYSSIDSSKTLLWECGDPFEWLDSAWMKKTYGAKEKDKGTFENYEGKVTTLFGQDIQFNSNSHIVLFNTASVTSNSFEIPSHHILLNKNTSLDAFKKMFPNAKLEKRENYETVARFYLEKDADDAFLFYFKNGKLNYFSLWWLLC